MSLYLVHSRFKNYLLDHVFLRNLKTVWHCRFNHEMPLERPHLGPLKNHRARLKQIHEKYGPGVVYLQFLGSGAKGAPRSLYLFSDHRKYLFNCGEGTQRMANEHKVKLAGLEHVFLTCPRWENIGGLLGLALTLQDVGVPEITIHGSEGLGRFFQGAQKFVILADLSIKMADCAKDTVYEDNVLSVNYIPIQAKDAEEIPPVEKSESSGSRSNNVSGDDADYYSFIKPKKKLQTVSAQDAPMGRIRMLMCYVCRLKPKAGVLNLEKCVEFGVPPGPLLGKLKNGINVTLPNGKLVRSADVVSQGLPGPVFIIVECPSLEFLENFVEEKEFEKYQAGASDRWDVATFVVHFTPPHIMENPKYKEWMKRFNPATLHVNCNEYNKCMGSVGVHECQYRLNLLDDKIFPILRDCSIHIAHDVSKPIHFDKEEELVGLLEKRKRSLDGNSKEDDTPPDLVPPIPVPPLHVGYTLRKIMFRPNIELSCSPPPVYIDSEAVVNEVTSHYHTNKELENLREKIKEIDRNIDKSKQYPEVLFLGTGSSIPNKHRNTSAILLTTSPNNHILLDCGEGTYSQMMRFFGPELLDEVLTQLKAVYISHLHTDHHIGFVGVLKARREAFHTLGLEPSKLYLLAPPQIINWLQMYDQHFEQIRKDIILISNYLLYDGSECDLSPPAGAFQKNKKRIQFYENSLKSFIPTSEEAIKEKDEALENLNMKLIQTTLVPHCTHSFGVALTHKDGWKLTYSGDTIPCNQLVDIGKGSDLLIHEATMEDELYQEAEHKMHSTLSQAIDIGKRMEAKFTILTHFSQRYSKIPRIDTIDDKLGGSVGVAFDNMRVSLADLKKLPLMYPALKLMFAQYKDELDRRSERRKRVKGPDIRESSSSSARIAY